MFFLSFETSNAYNSPTPGPLGVNASVPTLAAALPADVFHDARTQRPTVDSLTIQRFPWKNRDRFKQFLGIPAFLGIPVLKKHVLNATHLFLGIKQCQCTVNLKEIPLNSAFFGLVISWCYTNSKASLHLNVSYTMLRKLSV